MASTSKSEKIFIGIDDKVIELIGEDKTNFIAQREVDQAEFEASKAKKDQLKQLKISAYTKLGLTEEEINAIL